MISYIYITFDSIYSMIVIRNGQLSIELSNLIVCQ